MSPALAAALAGRKWARVDTLPAEVQDEAITLLCARAKALGYRTEPQPPARLLCGCPAGTPTVEEHGLVYCARCAETDRPSPARGTGGP